MFTAPGKVACDGCTLCCKGDAVRLLPGDDIDSYKTERHPRVRSARMLAHKENGDCIYLGDGGCTIHDRRPQMCRTMDCRLLAAKLPPALARSLIGKKSLQASVYYRGKELMHTLAPPWDITRYSRERLNFGRRQLYDSAQRKWVSVAEAIKESGKKNGK